MFTCTGKLIYSENPYKIIVEVDDEIAKYYRTLVPKYCQIQKPLYTSHISVLRNEVPNNFLVWNKYHDSEIIFEYDNYIHHYGLYYWINVSSSILEKIRVELGLESTSEFTRSPDNGSNFHMTIANIKHLI